MTQSKRIFVQPAPLAIDGAPVARVVRKPGGQPLAAAGDWVNSESYWLRRLADGDVEQPDNPPAEDAEPLAPSAPPADDAAAAPPAQAKK